MPYKGLNNKLQFKSTSSLGHKAILFLKSNEKRRETKISSFAPVLVLPAELALPPFCF
jgi:hypothetical protein